MSELPLNFSRRRYSTNFSTFFKLQFSVAVRHQIYRHFDSNFLRHSLEKQDRQCKHNVILTRVRTTAVAMGINKYEGKSLNNRNFIITFLQDYLQKLFVSYFST